MTDYPEKGGNSSGQSHNQETRFGAFKYTHNMKEIKWTLDSWNLKGSFSHTNLWEI